MDARLYFQLAEKLLEAAKNAKPLVPGRGEPECRAAISRAYYAVYNGVIQYLDRIGFEPGKSFDNHRVIQDALSQSGNDNLRTVGNTLNTLHTERKWADYYLRNLRPESVAHAESVLLTAGEMIRLIDQVAQGPPDVHGQIATAILRYVTSRQTEALKLKKRG